jgi:transcription elongation GreA/GreB family factor
MGVVGERRERLERELFDIESRQMVDAEAAVAAGQGVGDITENTDVALALAEVARLRRRREQIRIALSAQDTESDLSDGVIGLGTLVKLEFGDGEEETFLVGTVEDRHDAYSTLSMDSPIGQLVCGRRAGEAVMLGAESISIISVA